MRRHVLAGLLLAGCAQQLPAQVVNLAPSDQAIAAVALPEMQFRSMLAQVVFPTQSMAMTAMAMGVEHSCGLYRDAADRAITKHLPAWRTHLIRAYRDKVPAEMLKTVTEEGVAGGLRLAPYLKDIGQAMQNASRGLLKDAATEVLTEVVTQASKIENKKIDEKERMRELQEAVRKYGTICAGIPLALNTSLLAR